MYLQVHWVAPLATFTAQICTLLCGQTSATRKLINQQQYPICAPRSACFFAVKRPQFEINQSTPILIASSRSNDRNPKINQSTTISICALLFARFFAVKRPREAVLCLLNPGIDQSTAISICAPRYARFFAVKRPRFAACCQATANLRSNAST